MTAVVAPSIPVAGSLSARQVRTIAAVAVVAAAVIVASVLWPNVPGALDSHIQPAVRRMYRWITANRRDHWLFTAVFNPIADGLDAAVRFVLWSLRELRWSGVLVLTWAIGVTTGGWRAALWGTLAMFGVGVVGYWELTMITLALMIVGIVIALLIGIPLGIWTARSPLAEKVVRGFL